MTIEDGQLLGDSTDGRGFLRALADDGCAPRGQAVLVLGAGGAARAVALALTRADAHVQIAARKPDAAAATAKLGLDSLTKSGKLILVGLYGGEITLSLPPFPMKAITIQGSYTGSLTETAELIALVQRTGLPPVPVATRRLDDVNAVMDQLRAGKVVGRVVLTPA